MDDEQIAQLGDTTIRLSGRLRRELHRQYRDRDRAMYRTLTRNRGDGTTALAHAAIEERLEQMREGGEQ